jgi:hypothetical protein
MLGYEKWPRTGESILPGAKKKVSKVHLELHGLF